VHADEISHQLFSFFFLASKKKAKSQRLIVIATVLNGLMPPFHQVKLRSSSSQNKSVAEMKLTRVILDNVKRVSFFFWEIGRKNKKKPD